MAKIKEDLFYTWEDDYVTRDGDIFSMEDVVHYGLVRHVILEKERDEEPSKVDKGSRIGKWLTVILKGAEATWSIKERKWMVIDVYGNTVSVRPHLVRID